MMHIGIIPQFPFAITFFALFGRFDVPDHERVAF